MDDLRQIKAINKAFHKQREKYMFELSKTNKLIQKKTMLIQKMTGYMNEYFNNTSLKMSRSMPSLFNNLNLFIKQIDKVIIDTEREKEILKKSKDSIIKMIVKSDQKIKLMDHFEDRVVKEQIYKQDKVEQLMIDDISSTKHLRGNYE